MPYLYSILDTNAYVQLGAAKASALREAEDAHRIVGMASFWPVIELAAHLSDPTDSAYGRSWSALTGLWNHCQRYDGSRPYLPLQADTEAQLAYSLYQHVIPGREAEAELYGGTIGAIAAVGTRKIPPEHQAFVDLLAKHVRQREEHFTKDMEKVVRDWDPLSKGWQPFPTSLADRNKLLTTIDDPGFPVGIAKVRALATAAEAGATLGIAEITARGEKLFRDFPTPFYFYRKLLRKLASSGMDFSKPENANSIWDMSLSYTASPSANVKGVPTLLVTNEGQFHEAAAEGGHSDYVVRLPDYQGLLASGEIAALLERLWTNRKLPA